jgi:pimeloyl-ACP methyl ester carboxylesterase
MPSATETPTIAVERLTVGYGETVVLENVDFTVAHGDVFAILGETARDFAELSRTKLTMPVLVIGGDRSLGEVLTRQMKAVASDVKAVVLKDTGHWVLEERPPETTETLMSFL